MQISSGSVKFIKINQLDLCPSNFVDKIKNVKKIIYGYIMFAKIVFPVSEYGNQFQIYLVETIRKQITLSLSQLKLCVNLKLEIVREVQKSIFCLIVFFNLKEY